MSTNSTISMQDSTGEVRTIYCHWDGYLDGVGATLLEHYTTDAAVRQLIDLGDLSSLGQFAGEPPTGHTFDQPAASYCVAYHRDRGEPLARTKARSYLSADTLRTAVGQDYNYLWNGKDWRVAARVGCWRSLRDCLGVAV